MNNNLENEVLEEGKGIIPDNVGEINVDKSEALSTKLVTSNKFIEISCSSEKPVCDTQPENKNSELFSVSCLSQTISDESNIESDSETGLSLNISPLSQPTYQKLQNTKKRAGVLYRQLRCSKVHGISSKYFNQAHMTDKRWIPPRSPYALVQEDLFDNPWQLLVATIFLTKTAAKRAIPQLHKFLACYPRPEDVLGANYEDIDEYFKPLGLIRTRSHTIMRFTVDYLEKDWTYPRELYGIGKYGDDSYRMFCVNEWRQVSPDDIPLSMYRNWLLENAGKLGIE